MVKKPWSCEWVFCLSLLLVGVVFCEKHGNPANDLVDIINGNRTAHKLPKLNDSPGLGCMALQYAKECDGNCTTNNTIQCEPSDNDFTEVFAPDCGVELPTMDTISAHIIGCQSKYLQPSSAFSTVLARDKRSLSILRNKTHTEVGVGLIQGQKGNFFWCLLFSSGRVNSTFVLEDRGQGIKQKEGCFSGLSTVCSAAQKKSNVFLNNMWTVVLLVMCLTIGKTY